MKMILLEEVAKLGKAGTTVEVAPGYARNFLIPKKLAVEATPSNLKTLEHLLTQKRRLKERGRQRASALADRLGALSLTLSKRVGEQGKLFGSVTKAEIAEALNRFGVVVDRKQILLGEPIKALGEYAVSIRLHQDVVMTLKLSVVEAEPSGSRSSMAVGNPQSEIPQ